MRIALDIDGTITAIPKLFAALTRAPGVKRVVIVTSRTNEPAARSATKAELSKLGVRFDDLVMIDDARIAAERCPHDELDWYAKYLWQKVEVCLAEKIDVIYEDDVKVIELFRKFAPGIRVMQVHGE